MNFKLKLIVLVVVVLILVQRSLELLLEVVVDGFNLKFKFLQVGARVFVTLVVLVQYYY